MRTWVTTFFFLLSWIQNSSNASALNSVLKAVTLLRICLNCYKKHTVVNVCCVKASYSIKPWMWNLATALAWSDLIHVTLWRNNGFLQLFCNFSKSDAFDENFIRTKSFSIKFSFAWVYFRAEKSCVCSLIYIWKWRSSIFSVQLLGWAYTACSKNLLKSLFHFSSLWFHRLQYWIWKVYCEQTKKMSIFYQ